MSSVCSTVAEYVEQLLAVKELEDIYDNMEKEVVKIKKFYEFLKKFNFTTHER